MDSGDGPAVFVMFIVLVITIPLVFMVWAIFEPPTWVHAILWPIVVTGVSLALLRPAKGLMLGVQFKHKAGEHRVGGHGS
jgi:uncharacterized protein (DUF983 family)